MCPFVIKFIHALLISHGHSPKLTEFHLAFHASIHQTKYPLIQLCSEQDTQSYFYSPVFRVATLTFILHLIFLYFYC